MEREKKSNVGDSCNMFEDSNEFHGMTSSCADNETLLNYLKDNGISSKQELDNCRNFIDLKA